MRRIMTKPLDAHRRKVLNLLEEANISLVDAAIALGRNRAYMQQYITRGVPRELHERDRGKLAAMLNVHEDELREPTYSPTPAKAARVMPTVVLPTRIPERGPQDLPIRGKPGGRGMGSFSELNEPARKHVERPAVLIGSLDAYGIYVPDNCMAPALPQGTLAYLDPSKVARPGDNVLVRWPNGQGYIRRLVSQSGDRVVLCTHSPVAEETLDSADVTIVKIVSADFP